MVKNIDRKALEQELLKREAEELSGDFRKFVEAAWPLVEPGVPFMGGFHVDAICEHLQACAERKILRLLINVPPRHSKSTLCSVLFNAWVWTHAPQERFLSGSYSLQLATNDSVKTRRVVTSDWYRARWPHVQIAEEQAQKTFFVNTQLGQRQVTSVGGTTTGLGGTIIIGDDLISAIQADSAIQRQICLQWYRESFSTRNNTADTVRIIVMQRLHQNDVAGYLLREEGDVWDHLLLPGIFEGHTKTTSIGWTDPRKAEGDLLWPERYDQSEMDQLRRTLGSAAFAGQIQQRPVPRGGQIFKKEWLRFWYDPAAGTPDPVIVQRSNGEMAAQPQKPLPNINPESRVASFDLAFKGGPRSDYVVGQVWATSMRERANYYLLDQDRGQRDFVETLAAIRTLLARHPATMVLIEDKANGPAVINALKADVPGIIAVNPQGGKESRANGVSPLWEAGQVWLPHPTQAPWVDDFIEELTAFPHGVHDDAVDAMTQALGRMRGVDTIEFDSDFGPSVNSRISPFSGV